MKKLILIFLLLVSSTLLAAQDFYQFTNPLEKQRFFNLTTGLRCLVCQNQNLAESNAPLATDLRDQIYQQIISGKSDNDIINYLVSRYGNYILYKPPLRVATLGLWFGPLLFLVFGFCYLIFYLKQKSLRR